MRASKDRLRREIDELRAVGSIMANLCFNLAQNAKIDKWHGETMDELRRKAGMKDNLKVGDKVYLVYGGGWHDNTYSPGEVTKITPSGMIDVNMAGQTVRFTARQREQGKSYAYARWIDDEMTFQDRVVYVRKKNRTVEAVRALREIEVNRLTPQAEKSEIIAELDRIQGLVDAARAAAEKI